MAMIFPSTMVSDIRKAHASGSPIKKREIRFTGEYVGEPRTVLSPGGSWVVGLEIETWCSSCGKRIPKDDECIMQAYELYPKPDDPRRGQVLISYFHLAKCQHAGGIG